MADETLAKPRFNPMVWALRLATIGMLVAGVVVAARKYSTTPEQDELTRFATLTVPVYLADVADAQARFDRVTSPDSHGADGGTLTPAEARAMLVDDLMPALIRVKKRASLVETSAASVRASNEEYLAAVDKLIEAGRTAVRAIDDPLLSGEAGYKQMRQRRREAHEALGAWMMHLRERCEKAGLKIQ